MSKIKYTKLSTQDAAKLFAAKRDLLANALAAAPYMGNAVALSANMEEMLKCYDTVLQDLVAVGKVLDAVSLKEFDSLVHERREAVEQNLLAELKEHLASRNRPDDTD